MAPISNSPTRAAATGDAAGEHLRVVHCVGFYFPDSTGGTEVYVRDLATALSRRSIDSTIIAATDGTYDRYSWQGVEVIRYPITAVNGEVGSDGRMLATRTAFQEIVLEAKPDLFHLHSWTTGAGLVHLRQVARLGIPSVVTMHVASAICMRGTMLLYGKQPCDGAILEQRCARCWAEDRGFPAPVAYALSRLPRWDANNSIVARLSQRATTTLSVRAIAASKARDLRSMAALSERIVAPSQWVRAALVANAIPAEKIVVSAQSASESFGIEPAHRRMPGVHDDAIVGFLGRLEPNKGVDTLLKGFSMVSRELPVRLRVAGVGTERSYMRVVERAARNDPRVEFVGLVEHEAVPEFLRGIDILAVPSRCLETGPIVVQEAHALGIPVMGAGLGGIAERVRDGVDGWLLPFDDPKPWADVITSAVSDRRKLSAMAAHIRRNRSINDVASDMVDLYREVMEEDSRQARAGG